MQPMGSCHHWEEEHSHPLYQLPWSPGIETTIDDLPSVDQPPSPVVENHTNLSPSSPHHYPYDPDPDGANAMSDVEMGGSELPGKFTEAYEGCSEAFPGGWSFIDRFSEDQYTDERQQNLYFPFASQEEWQFASWLLHSHLSLATIDSLLSLDIVCLIIPFFPVCIWPNLSWNAHPSPSGLVRSYELE